MFNNESLASITDVERVRKIYKLNSPGESGKKDGKRENEARDQANGRSPGLSEMEWFEEMEKVILGMMAIKGS